VGHTLKWTPAPPDSPPRPQKAFQESLQARLIPIPDPTPAPPEPFSERKEQPTAQAVQLACRVLLAEDGPNNQRLNSFILRKAGAEVTVAENGQVALDLALAAREAGTPFDVILMDIQMPVMDGFEATRKLREADYTLPIVALTANDAENARELCLQAGCDEYVAKPVTRETLIHFVAHYTSPSQTTEDCNV
jgi:CheY-like chemotaxis protein